MIFEIIIVGLLTNINRKDDCDKARRHIGKGCAMVVENGDVWILNQSDSSIFVQVNILQRYDITDFHDMFRAQYAIIIAIFTLLQL